ncbi:MAG: prepilin peptidase [Chloroflexi bacterium]|nr:MAG: prepilin peptidase [Chloroflexota bacterium]
MERRWCARPARSGCRRSTGGRSYSRKARSRFCCGPVGPRRETRCAKLSTRDTRRRQPVPARRSLGDRRRSVFALVLIQVVFFDFEHRLILDRVMFPAMALALLVSLSPLFASGLGLWHQPWWIGILMGMIAGVLFLALALAGSAIFKAEALGFGDVKLAAFMGLVLGWPYTFTAMFYGVVLAGLVAIGYIAWHRSLKGTIAYGPYLAAGALIMLLDPLK